MLPFITEDTFVEMHRFFLVVETRIFGHVDLWKVRLHTRG